ncbi:MAG: transcriptional regulator [Pseudomonadales bacterium]
MNILKKGTNIPDMGTPIENKPQSLADALFTTTQQRLLGLLFGQPNRSFFVTEIIDLVDMGRGAVQRELQRLARSGLLLTRRVGNQKHYQANSAAPIFDELCAIVEKTLGIQEMVRNALQPLAQKIELSLIYGSVAKRTDSVASDIDLLVVADELMLEDLNGVLVPVEKRLARKISPTLLTTQEFEQRRVQSDSFVQRVIEGEVNLIVSKLK